MSSSLTKILADFAHQLSFKNLNPEVRDISIISILDALACAFEGRRLPTSEITLRVLDDLMKDGKATLWTEARKGNFLDVAWANTLLVHSILHDDTQWSVMGHMGSVIIPTAFAVGEQLNSSGTDVIAAIVAAYEVAGRIGRESSLAVVDRGFRGSGIFGPFASAVAAGKLMGLDADELANAISCASTFSSGTLVSANNGTPEWRFEKKLFSLLRDAK